MADKMWDILRFLKNPDGAGEQDESAARSAAVEKDQINAQLISALQETENAIDEAILEED